MRRVSARVGIVLCLACLCLVALSFPPAQGSAQATEAAGTPRVEPFVSGPALVDAPLLGAHPFLTILCRFADSPNEPVQAAFVERLMGNEYPGMGHYWREVSYGRMSLEGSKVVGWVSLPAGKDGYKDVDGLPDFLKLAQDCVRSGGVDLHRSSYSGLNLAFNVEIGAPRGGRICLDPSGSTGCYGVTWLFPPRLDKQATWAHEMGHALGLEHTGRDPGRAYGNIWDVMSEDGSCGSETGFGPIAEHVIAYHKDRLGWLLPSEKISIAAPGETEFELAPLALPPATGNRFLLAEIPIGGADDHFYTVEARVRAGYDRYLPADAVVIHEVDLRPLRDGRRSQVTLRWQSSPDGGPAASDFFDAQHGITVGVERQTEDAFRVDVRVTAGSATDAAADAGAPILPQSILSAIRHERETTPAAVATSEQAGRAEGVASASLMSPGRAIETDGQGHQHEVWVAVENGPSEAILYGERQPDRPEERIVAIDQGAEPGAMATPALAVGRKGELYAAWAQLQEGSWQIRFASAGAGGTDWTCPEEISSVVAGDAWAPALATDGRGSVYVLWQQRTECGLGAMTAIYLAVRDGDGRWSPLEKVDPNPTTAFISDLLLVSDDVGNLYAEWQDKSAEGIMIYASFRPRHGQWSNKWERGQGEDH